MMIRFTLTTERAKEKLIKFVGEKSVVRNIPLEGMGKFSVDLISANLLIGTDNNTIILTNTMTMESMELFTTEYLVIKIF